MSASRTPSHQNPCRSKIANRRGPPWTQISLTFKPPQCFSRHHQPFHSTRPVEHTFCVVQGGSGSVVQGDPENLYRSYVEVTKIVTTSDKSPRVKIGEN